MSTLLDGVDVVCHLASAHLQISLDASEYWSVNVHSLQPFMQLAMENGVKRFIHTSSVGVYGDIQELPADEETLCKPQSIYGETKLAGEEEIWQFSRKNGLPAVILRPAWVYGTWCPRTLKLYRALRKGRFVMIGKGNNFRHPVHISDMLEAYRLSMEKKAEGELFVIGGERPVTTLELIHTFCDDMGLRKPKFRIPYSLGFAAAVSAEKAFGIMKKEPPVSRRTLEFFTSNTAFDTFKARNLLGFMPKQSLSNGLRACREWLEKMQNRHA
jgi:nucleoside-diphosphate-sugar epimerase